MVRLLLVFLIALAGTAGCRPAKGPELRVLGVQDQDQRQRRHEVVVVQVTNPASRPMRLTKLEYRFAAAGGTTVSEGELDLHRDVPAGAAVVVEVPFDTLSGEPTTLRGKLTTELDHIVRIFKVSAQIQPPR